MNRWLGSLRARLLLTNLVVAGVALGTVVVAVSVVGPGYFAQAMGHPSGSVMGSMMDSATGLAFDDALRNALIAAGAIAVGASVVLSLAVSGAIAEPVTRLASASRRIAAGHYRERVPAAGAGEIGELAAAFNAMSGSLEATEARRMQLVGDVAHELRTPLATLDGYLEGLEDGVIPASDDTWRLLRGETARLTRLVDGLQELWRAEARQLPLRVEPLDALSVAADAVERFAPQATARQIALENDVPSGLTLLADRDRLIQILGNFLSNAIRFSPDGAGVVIRARRAGNVIEFSVVDQGPGLTPEQRVQVFERFYRVDPSRSRALGGSGIGLAIALALATAMDGSVRAESGEPGTGSTFVVTLPVA